MVQLLPAAESARQGTSSKERRGARPKTSQPTQPASQPAHHPASAALRTHMAPQPALAGAHRLGVAPLLAVQLSALACGVEEGASKQAAELKHVDKGAAGSNIRLIDSRKPNNGASAAPAPCQHMFWHKTHVSLAGARAPAGQQGRPGAVSNRWWCVHLGLGEGSGDGAGSGGARRCWATGRQLPDITAGGHAAASGARAAPA